MTLSRLLHLTALSLALGIVLGWGLAWVEARPYSQVRDVLWVLRAEGMMLGVALAAAAVAVWVALYLMARARRPGLAARVAALVAFVPLLVWFEQRDQAGGGRIPTLALVVGGLLGLELLARLLRHAWEARVRLPAPAIAVLVLAAVPAFAVAKAQPGRDDAPDILFILLDVARADHFSCYGYERPTSPNLDRLAEDSVLFENAISSSTFTKTSVATLFTGLNAHHHGVYIGTRSERGNIKSDVLGDRFTTLAEAMFDAGRNTVAWVQNGQLRAYMGFDQGFSRYHDQPGRADRIANGFMDWVERWGDRAPYFAYLHILDLHAPYHPPPPFQGRFGSKQGDLSDQMNDDSWHDFKEDVLNERRILSEEELAGFESRYDELIAHVDSWVGRIVDELKATGRYDDTMIVVTSDHGEGFWEHGFISHSTIPYEELVHVPLIVKMPGSVGAGRRVETMVGGIDLMPTLLDFAGAPVPEGVEGRSILPLLDGSAEALDPGWLVLEFRNILAVRTERWKLIRAPGWTTELYDVQADPGETRNILEEHADVAERLGQAIRRSLQLRREAGAADTVTVDDETVEALEALGYL